EASIARALVTAIGTRARERRSHAIHLRRKQNGSRPFALVDWNSPSDHPFHLAFRRASLADRRRARNKRGAACGASSCSWHPRLRSRFAALLTAACDGAAKAPGDSV